jgi:hypothetical protein
MELTQDYVQWVALIISGAEPLDTIPRVRSIYASHNMCSVNFLLILAHLLLLPFYEMNFTVLWNHCFCWHYMTLE